MDDGSTDGTAEMVRAEFPMVRLESSVESRGYIVQRNLAARLASGEIIFSLDDDAEFSTPLVVEQTLRDFNNPRIGAVAIPFLEPNKANRLMQSPPDINGTWITDAFIGTAHALRRDLFLALGGYREALVHQGEESDFCVRMLDAGHVVRLGRADSIRHWESPKRDFLRVDFYGTRNSVLFQWQNAPCGWLLQGVIATTFNCLRWTLKPARLWVRFLGVCAGYRGFARQPRRPVRPETYRLWRQLRKQGPLPLTKIVCQISADQPPNIYGN